VKFLAGALQDYVALWSLVQNTFGKGTVQTILPIGQVRSLLGSKSDEDGALKCDVQKFYRVAGGSHSFTAVASDIILPSLSDLPELAKAHKERPGYDEVIRRDTRSGRTAIFLCLSIQLRRRSEERIKNDPEFHYVMDDIGRLRHNSMRESLCYGKETRVMIRQSICVSFRT